MKTYGLSVLRTIFLLAAASLTLTLASYAVVTGRNIHLDPLEKYVLINGDYVINLPCAPVDDTHNWVSSDPVLPEARGLPLNYHFWNPCYGDKVLRMPFLLDAAFWFAASLAALIVYRVYREIKPARMHRHSDSS
jgi:hypothetical protein